MHVQEERTDCANCGAVLAGDARFCQRCGAPVASLVRGVRHDEPVDEAEQPVADSSVWTSASRVGALVLIALTAAAVLFTMLVLGFGLFVE